MGHFHPVLVNMNFIHLGRVGNLTTLASQVEGVTWKPGMATLVGSVGKAGFFQRLKNLPMDDFDTSMNISLIYLEGDR